MSPSRRLYRVLLVEDHAGIREAFRIVLEIEGYLVDTAENGEEGLHQLRADPPAVILLDLVMPVMDGMEFRSEQLADPKVATIPVVICSSVTLDDLMIEQLKATAYLRKPVEIAALLSTVSRVLETNPGLRVL